MCGIVGFLNLNGKPADRGTIQSLTDLIAHRGPDGEGIELRGPLAFGHRRLSIIDPSLGRQPMTNEDGTIWITFNGEIYNFPELRLELLARGHKFKTHCDTEAIIHAYEEWGSACVERFRGMFAFGIADFNKQELFVARDNFGMKPLYFIHTPELFAFCSEFHPLTKIPGIELSLDLQAIDEFLWLQYIPAPKTAVEEIKKLLPAQRMTIGFDGKIKGPEEYWSFAFHPTTHRSETELVDTLDEILQDSVKAHLLADVPFGVFLSGGVDSSLVLAYMTKILGRPIDAFSIGFEEEGFNETDYARQAAKLYGAKHHVEIVRPAAMEMLPELVRHYGEPFGDSSALPTYYVSKMARKHVPMVLSGDGPDESFAGYWSHRDFMARFAKGGEKTNAKNVNLNYERSSYDPTLADWLEFIHYFPVPDRMQLWKPELRSICPGPINVFHNEFAKASSFSLAHRVQYLDLKTYLPYDILTKVDIASMMNGLEVRVPFVDKRVVEFASTIPERHSIGIGSSGEWERKLLLKKVAERYYPKEFVNRPKMGFAMPVAKWFAPGGELHNTVRERLLSPSSPLAQLFEHSAMDNLISRGAFGQMWLLLVLDEWMTQNL